MSPLTLLLTLTLLEANVGRGQGAEDDLESELFPPPSARSAAVVAIQKKKREESEPMSCDVASLKCAYRVGCGMALHNYKIGCYGVMTGQTQICPDHCKKALIALTSTEEGQELMRCRCENGFCEETKRRIEVCRPDVVWANNASSVVTCSVAQWICAADNLCATALQYYHRFCRAMFHGRKCSPRCNNSLAILLRQDKAHKLKTCRCDGSEDYDCDRIKQNMENLCFLRLEGSDVSENDVTENDVPDDGNENENEVYRTLVSAADTTNAAVMLGASLLVQVVLRVCQR